MDLSSVYAHRKAMYGLLEGGERRTYIVPSLLPAASSAHMTAPASPAKGLDWRDMVYRYNSEEDIFRIFFVQTRDAERKSEVPLAPDVYAVLDGVDVKSAKILIIEIRNASKTLGCHLLDFPCEIDGWPACTLLWSYDDSVDTLDIYFMPRDTVKRRFKQNTQSRPPFAHDIIFDLDQEKRYISIEILSASVLCKKRLAAAK